MPTGGGAWSPLTGHPAPSRPVQHAPPVGPCGSAQQGPPQGACCQGSETQAEAPVAPCASQRGRCAGAPGGGRAPQLPAASGKAAGMSRACLRPPHPTPTSWGEQAPHHPGSQAHPALAQASCPLDRGQQPAAFVGVGAWRAPCGGRKGQEAPPSPTPGVLCPPPLPPGRQPPEPGLGLEKRMDYAGARPKHEPGHGGARCGLGSGLQARASRLCWEGSRGCQ